MSDILEKLLEVQIELKAPKSQYNAFGKYNYRNCEDILEAVKPLCKKHGVCLTITDNVEQLGDRYYVSAQATITEIGAVPGEPGKSVTSVAFAREQDAQPGMQSPQISGGSSSYARKYALNALLLIDDTKDADFHDNRSGQNSQKKPAAEENPKKYKDFNFLTTAGNARKVLGDQPYYEVLGLEGYEHANEIPPDKREKVLIKWRQKAKGISRGAHEDH